MKANGWPEMLVGVLIHLIYTKAPEARNEPKQAILILRMHELLFFQVNLSQ